MNFKGFGSCPEKYVRNAILSPTSALLSAGIKLYISLYQDQPVAAEPTTISSAEKAEKSVEHIPTQLCSTSHPSNPPMKFKRKLMEVDKLGALLGLLKLCLV